MEEDVFDSIDAIDAALDKEFGEVANEPEEVPEPVQEENTNKVEEGASNEEPKEEQNKSEESQETQPQDIKNEEPKTETKKDYAFAQLRTENSDLKKERDGYKADSDYLKELAASYGYDDVSKFQDAIREARYQKEAQDKGYDPALYRKTMEQERRIAQLEKEREQEIQDRKLERFQVALDNAVKTYSIDAQEIFSRLEDAGIPAEEILNSSNPKLLLDGVLIDRIQNSAKQSQIKDIQNLEGLVEDKNEQSGSVPKVTIESLLKDDLAQYKKDNFYY